MKLSRVFRVFSYKYFVKMINYYMCYKSLNRKKKLKVAKWQHLSNLSIVVQVI